MRLGVFVGVMALAAAFVGCSGDEVLGSYRVVNIDKTLVAITEVPTGFTDNSLPEYREQIKKKYANKRVQFTSDRPHEFVFSTGLEGSVKGLLNGGWMRNPTNRQEVLVYQWVSGSLYALWGSAMLTNNLLTVTLDGLHSRDGVVLYLKK